MREPPAPPWPAAGATGVERVTGGIAFLGFTGVCRQQRNSYSVNAKAIKRNTPSPEQLQLSLWRGVPRGRSGAIRHTQALGLCPQLFVPIWVYADTCAIHSVDPQDGVFAAARLRPSLRTQMPKCRLQSASREGQRHCAALASFQAMFLSNAAALRLWTVHAA